MLLSFVIGVQVVETGAQSSGGNNKSRKREKLLVVVVVVVVEQTTTSFGCCRSNYIEASSAMSWLCCAVESFEARSGSEVELENGRKGDSGAVRVKAELRQRRPCCNCLFFIVASSRRFGRDCLTMGRTTLSSLIGERNSLRGSRAWAEWRNSQVSPHNTTLLTRPYLNWGLTRASRLSWRLQHSLAYAECELNRAFRLAPPTRTHKLVRWRCLVVSRHCCFLMVLLQSAFHA